MLAKDPKPRPEEEHRNVFSISTSDYFIDLDPPATLELENRSFLEVIWERRSCGTLKPISYADLSKFLLVSHQLIHADKTSSGLSVEFQPSMSAGGLRSITPLFKALEGKNFWFEYQNDQHSLSAVNGLTNNIDDYLNDLEKNRQINGSVLILYAGDLCRLSGKYSNPESLLWRDAGVMMNLHSIVASYLGLTYSPLGQLGQPIIDDLEGCGDSVLGTGMAVLGGPN